LRDLVQVEVVGHDFPLQGARELDQLEIDLANVGKIQVGSRDLDPDIFCVFSGCPDRGVLRLRFSESEIARPLQLLSTNCGIRGLDLRPGFSRRSRGRSQADRARARPAGENRDHDFNLNKVAQLRGVDVLNVNELANSLKRSCCRARS